MLYPAELRDQRLQRCHEKRPASAKLPILSGRADPTDDLPVRLTAETRYRATLRTLDTMQRQLPTFAALQELLECHRLPPAGEHLGGHLLPGPAHLGGFRSVPVVPEQPIGKVIYMPVVPWVRAFWPDEVNCEHPKQRSRLDPRRLHFCRGGQIRTDDLLLPKQARYRATLRPDCLSAYSIDDPAASRRRRDTGLRYARWIMAHKCNQSHHLKQRGRRSS